MEILFDIVKELYESLEKNQENLSVVKRADFNYKKENMVKLSEIAFRLFLENKLESEILLDKMRWGQLINLDLLADFLIQTIYKNLPHGKYENSKDELKIIKEYDEIKKAEIFNVFLKSSFINMFMNYFITYVRQNYNMEFLKKFQISEIRDIIDHQITMNHVCNKLLKSGDYYSFEDLNTADKVLKYVNEEENSKRDRLSYFIDSTDFSNVCVKEYNLFLEEIENFINLASKQTFQLESEAMENRIYLNFAMVLKGYINSRIEFLSKNISFKKTK